MINTQFLTRGKAYLVEQALKPNQELPLKNIKFANFPRTPSLIQLLA